MTCRHLTRGRGRLAMWAGQPQTASDRRMSLSVPGGRVATEEWRGVTEPDTATSDCARAAVWAFAIHTVRAVPADFRRLGSTPCETRPRCLEGRPMTRDRALARSNTEC